MKKRWIPFIAGLFCLVTLDQLSKLVVLRTLKPYGPLPLISGVLELSYVENRGAAFGIMQNRQWFFVIITVLVVAAIIWMLPRIPAGKHFLPLKLCALFIAGGAVGNMIDRVGRGYVVDFIYFKLIDFPVFNVADIYVTCSAFALAFLLLFFYKEEELDGILPGKGV